MISRKQNTSASPCLYENMKIKINALKFKRKLENLQMLQNIDLIPALHLQLQNRHKNLLKHLKNDDCL